MSKVREISRTISPVERIAMVLFAVHKFDSAVMSAIENSAARCERTLYVTARIRYSNPPFIFTISNKPPASMVTMISSPIEAMPPPIEENISTPPIEPVNNPMRDEIIIPITSTTSTFIPQRAVIITTI